LGSERLDCGIWTVRLLHAAPIRATVTEVAIFAVRVDKPLDMIIFGLALVHVVAVGWTARVEIGALVTVITCIIRSVALVPLPLHN
jgi:hypothetical protein